MASKRISDLPDGGVLQDTDELVVARAGDNARVSGATLKAIASGDVAAHEADTTNVHGIADTSVLETLSGAQDKADAAQSAAEAYTDAHAETPAGAQAKADAAQAAAQTHADTAVSGEATARAAADALKLDVSAVDTDGTLAADSDARVSSQKATRTFVITRAGQFPQYQPSGDTAGVEDVGQLNDVFFAEYGGAYLVANVPMGLPPYYLGSPLLMGDYRQLLGAGRGATLFQMADGANCHGIASANWQNSTGNTGIKIQGLTIDGNKSKQSGNWNLIYMFQTSDSEAGRVEARNGVYRGIVFHGNALPDFSRRNVLEKSVAHGCSAEGLVWTSGNRAGKMLACDAYNNGVANYFLDASELEVALLYAYAGVSAGFYLHNVTIHNLGPMTAFKNGGHGYLVLGYTNSTGGPWLASNNSYGNPGSFDNFNFNGGQAPAAYGITDKALISLLVSGYAVAYGTDDIRSGIRVEDADVGLSWNDFKIEAAYVASPGHSGTTKPRVPAAFGSGMIGWYPAGSRDKVWITG